MSDTAVETAIAESAVGPKSVTTPDGTVTQHPLPEQIEADRYLKNRAAAADPFACLRKRTVAFGGDV